VAALFLAFAVVELWTPIVHGGYFLPGDLGQVTSMTRVGGGATLAPQNRLPSDVYVDFGPFLHFDAAQVGAGHFPTWNPYNGNGQPYFADDQTVVASPFTLPFYFLNFRLALIAAALARLWLLGFITYLFLARHRLGTLSAAVGGAIFAYAGYHLVWLDYQTQVSVSATLPIALWCVRIALDHGPPGRGESVTRQGRKRERSARWFALVGLAAALAVIIYDGHPETAVFDIALIVGYAVIAVVVEGGDWRARLRWAARLVSAAALALGLAAFQLLPFLQYTGAGARPAQLRANPAASATGFSPGAAPLMAFPNLLGGPQFAYDNLAFWSHQTPLSNYAEANGSTTGLLALALVPLGLVAAWRRRRQAIAWFGVAASVVGAVVLFSRVVGLWWHDVPLVGSAGLNRSQDVLLLGVAVLAALGVESMTHWGGSIRRRLGAVGAVILSFAAVSVALLIGALDLRNRASHVKGSRAGTEVAMRIVRDNITAELILAGAFAILLGTYVLVRRGRLRWLLAPAMIVLAFASNGLVMQSYNPTVKPAFFYPDTSAVRDLVKVTKSDEVVFVNGYFPAASVNLWFGVHDVGSYDAIGFKWHDALYDKVFDVKVPYAEQMPQCLGSLQLFGIEWVVGGPGVLRNGSTQGVNLKAYLYKIPAYRVSGAALVSVVGRSITARGSDQRALAAVSRCSFRPDRTVVLDPTSYRQRGPGSLSAPRGRTAATDRARVTSRSAGALSVRATSKRPGWLVVRQTFAPGWQATVDGHPVPVQRADVAFQAVRLPAGTHTVRLLYRPASVSIGLVVSVLSALVAAGLCLVAFLWRRRARPGHAVGRFQRRPGTPVS
jgi:hypothetical protein